MTELNRRAFVGSLGAAAVAISVADGVPPSASPFG